MSPARVTETKNRDGSVSFKVVYRRGGRGFRQEYAGTFRGWPGSGRGVMFDPSRDKINTPHKGWTAPPKMDAGSWFLLALFWGVPLGIVGVWLIGLLT